jgi:hypothetical protein
MTTLEERLFDAYAAGASRRAKGQRALEAARHEAAQLRNAITAVVKLHSPRPGWEREWLDPDEALANGWPVCAGCIHSGGTAHTLATCPTRAALKEAGVLS